MDRLPAIGVALALGLGMGSGCDESPHEKEQQAAAAEGPSRFVAVANEDEGRSPEAFCDAYTPGEDAESFEAPPLAGDGSFPSDGWRWINVWATWCKPCIEEMPVLAEWKQKLHDEGAEFDLVFLSVDETDELIAEFRADHPQTPDSHRLESPDALPEFLGSVGLSDNTPIPVQIFVDPQDHVRCVRAGAVNPDDYSAIGKILL